MTVFLVCVVVLLALALLLVLPTLLRAHAPEPDASADQRRANLLVLREQLAALDAELGGGKLDAETHRLARIEIERRVLEEGQEAERPAVAGRAGKTALALGVSIPLLVVVVYGVLGDPQALESASSQAAGGQHDASAAQIEALVEKLALRLESKTTVEADDLQAWTMLGRSFAALQRFPEASRAFARARTLAPGDAQLLADHADVMAMVQKQSLAGEPSRLVEQALKIDPNNTKALALAGSAAFQSKDFVVAADYWSRALQLAPPGSEFATGLERSIQEARAAATSGAPGAGTAVAGAPRQPAPVASAPKTAAAGTQTSGVVQLAGALAAKVKPDDTVFIFARAAEGPRMPLAILKRKAGELPISFGLDDSSAMSPELSLSKFPSVVISARISRSGNATPSSGDLIGQVGPVPTGASKLVVTIDAVQP